MLTECLISVEMANGLRTVAYSLGVKSPKVKRVFRCPTCKQPVKPFVSAEGKFKSHFEHFAGARPCKAQ